MSLAATALTSQVYESYYLVPGTLSLGYSGGVLVSDAQPFLDNLENLRVVSSVALEYVQDRRDEFAKSATGVHARRAEKVIHQLRVVIGELEKEFAVLEYLLGESSPSVPRADT